jgi:hypothetical protein
MLYGVPTVLYGVEGQRGEIFRARLGRSLIHGVAD